MIDETFLTTEEVLEYLQVNLRTVYRLIKAGKIPAVRVGRQWRFRKRDIDAWLDSQRGRGPRVRRRPHPAAGGATGQRGLTRRVSSSSTTKPASETCSPRRWRSRSTTSTSRPTVDQRSIGCGCTPTICSSPT